MNIVYTKVVADLFHYGHSNFFKAARALGDLLVVHVVDDARVRDAKRLPIMTQQERMAVVAACRYVDRVTAEGPKIITPEFMARHGYHLYAFSYVDEQELRTKRADCPDLPDEMLGIIKYTAGISTTEILQRVHARSCL